VVLLLGGTLAVYAQPSVTTDELRDAICRYHPTDQICATATPSPTAPPTPTPTPAPTATPIPPTPTPTPTPPSTEVVGYGSGATGGTTIVTVGTIAQLRSALSSSGNRITLTGSGVWDGNGTPLTVRANTTIDGGSVILKDTWVQVRGSNVILRNLRVRSGDLGVSVDADAINLNGGPAPISDIVLDHVEAIWAPDVGGVVILNRVTDVTIQHSIIGVGLTRSIHPESNDADGHNLAFNIAGQGSGIPERITVYRNLITTAQGRMPQVQGAKAVDFVNNVIYNYEEAPQGNPQGLNLVNNVYRHGPAVPSPERFFWRTRTSGDHPNAYPDSVYLSGNVPDGFTAVPPASPANVLRSTPYGVLSVQPEATANLLDRVLAEAGPSPRDAKTLRWIDEAQTRSGVYWNGDGFPAPNPSWP
jgi:hypothetical protein